MRHNVKLYFSDISPPVFDQCPSGFVVYADKGSTETTINFMVECSDINDGDLTPVQIEGPIGSVFSVTYQGPTVMKYTCTDSSANEAEPCQFSIVVQGNINSFVLH